MTQLMEQAIDRLRKMPDDEQDRMAQFVLSEIEEDARWTGATLENEAKLNGLIRDILHDDDAGKCDPLDLEST